MARFLHYGFPCQEPRGRPGHEVWNVQRNDR